jgi:hypothetical protein
MKMNSKNPGGEGPLKASMKGCEFGQKKGEGSLKQFTQKPGMGSLSGPSRPGDSHINKSFSGAKTSGSSKACR